MWGLSMRATLGLFLFAPMLVAGQDTLRYEEEMMPLEKLTEEINSDAYDEGSPVISLDGKRLYFTRSGYPVFVRTLVKDGMDVSATYAETDYRSLLCSIYSEISNESIAEPYASAFNQDIWIAHLNEDSIGSVSHPGYPINNALPNSVLTSRLDSNKLVVVNQFYSDGSMHEGLSIVEGGEEMLYSFPVPLHIYDFYNLSADINLAMSTRGQVMIMSLERRDSRGGKDLYVSFKIQDDLWSEPENLGAVLNTTYMESTPFISHDNRRLYFASNRPGTMGGLDIYVSERLDYTWLKWTEPKPLKAPVNSLYDDSQPFFDDVNSNLYFTSRRDGSSDIFRLPLKPKPKLKAPIRINGKIVDGVTLRPVRAELLYGPNDVKNYLEYTHTYTGEFQFELTEYGVYKFRAYKPGYGDAHLMFDTRLAEKADLPVHEVILYLYRDSSSTVSDPLPITDVPPIHYKGKGKGTEEVITTYQPKQVKARKITEVPKVGEKITFYNIYFEKGKPVILNTSEEALEELYTILSEYPSMHILIEGHTDNVGDELSLLELSWQRAQAVKVYLAQHGIDPVRINTVGYGATRPVSNNFTEDGRERNRRVEVQVLR